MTITATLLDCGHEPSSHDDFTTGYGTDDKGQTYCYACCTARDVAEMRVSNTFVAYVNDDATAITNWPGHVLGRVLQAREIGGGFGGSMLYIRARDSHGAEWYGHGAGKNMVIRLHKAGGK